MQDQIKSRIVNIALFGAVAAAGIIIWAAVNNSRVAPPPPASPAPVVIAAAPAPSPPRVDPIPVPAPVMPELPPPVAQKPPTPPVAAPAPVAPLVVRPVQVLPPNAVIAEPDARVALAAVGRDPAAAGVWAQAINDTTNLTPSDRKNLIEDLNETGFADPNNLTQADLPVINNRLDLIDALYWDAADDTNAAAFDEAYKDLLAMRAQLMGL